MEEDFHSVAPGRYDWWQEVQVFFCYMVMVGWINSGEAADLVNQSYPVPIGDFDIVVMVTGSRITMNSKVRELQPQYLPTLHLDFLCLVKVVGVIAREVWRGDNTCEKEVSPV